MKPWLGELRLAPHSLYVEGRDFYPAERATIDRLIGRSTTVVACDPEMESHNYGFACFDAHAVHWIYVVNTFRRMGIGGLLFAFARTHMGLDQEAEVLCSYASQMFGLKKLREKYRLRYVPYLLRQI
jgi:hypothetical protein